MKSKTPKRKTPRHFFWDKKLHKVLRINRPANLVEAWCFQDRKSVTLLHTDFRTNAKPAIQTGDAAVLLNTTIRTLKLYIARGDIRTGDHSYALDGKYGASESSEYNRAKYKIWWGEHHLMEIHEYLINSSPVFSRPGRPALRNGLPTKAEIHAYFNNSPVMYVKNNEGEFIPVFNQPKW